MRTETLSETDLLTQATDPFREKPYRWWRERVEQEPIHFRVKASGDVAYHVQVEAYWDRRPGGDIRAFVAVDDPRWSAHCPVANDFLVPRPH